MDGSCGPEVTGNCDHRGHWKFKVIEWCSEVLVLWKALVTGGYFEISAHWEASWSVVLETISLYTVTGRPADCKFTELESSWSWWSLDSQGEVKGPGEPRTR